MRHAWVSTPFSHCPLVGFQENYRPSPGKSKKTLENARILVHDRLHMAQIWERELDAANAAYVREVDVPYGYKVAADTVHLEVEDAENSVLLLCMELIVQDQRLSQIAKELNKQGYRTRNGFIWNPASVFELLPRLIESRPGRRPRSG